MTRHGRGAVQTEAAADGPGRYVEPVIGFRIGTSARPAGQVTR